MYDGIAYVIAAYSVMAVMLVIWFAMIIRRFRTTIQRVHEAQLND